MIHYAWCLFALIVGIIIGVFIGYSRMEWFIATKTRKMVKTSHHCYMCVDCPDGCPLDTPDDSRNNQQNRD